LLLAQLPLLFKPFIKSFPLFLFLINILFISINTLTNSEKNIKSKGTIIKEKSIIKRIKKKRKALKSINILNGI
jgi:hypothetical protein